MQFTDNVGVNRRRLLAALGASATLAGCSSIEIGGGDGDSGDGGDGESDGGVGDSSDGDSGDGDAGDVTAPGGDEDTPTPTEAPTPTPVPTADETDSVVGDTTVVGTGASSASVRTPGSDAGVDWEAIGDQEEAGPFDVPDDVPTAFGWSRVSTTNTMTFSYGAMAGESDPVEEGTVYLLFIVDDSVQHVLVWETPIEHGEEFTVGPEDSTYAMDVTTLTDLVIAYDDGEDVYVVDKNADFLD